MGRRATILAFVLLAVSSPVSARELEPPESIAVAVRRLEGKAVAGSFATLEEYVATLEVPGYLKTVHPAGAEGTTDPEAVKLYIVGRDHFLREEFRQAGVQLEAALRLDADAVEVLQLLGMSYYGQQNFPRASRALERAVAIQPGDAKSLYFLGASAFRRGDLETAIVVLSRIDAEAPDTPVEVRFLRPYYLAQALLERGQVAPAVVELTRILETEYPPVQVSRLYAEALLLDRQRSGVGQQLGDLLCRLGRYEEAARRYDAAVEDAGPLEEDGLAARRVYARLALNQAGEAERILVERLRDPHAGAVTLALVPYLAGQTGDGAGLGQRLRDAVAQGERTTAMVVAVATLMSDEEAGELLLEQLGRNPEDMNALGALIERLGKGNPERLAGAMVKLVREHPAHAQRLAGALFEHGFSVAGFLRALDALPAGEGDSAAAHYLRGAAYQNAGRFTAASSSYDRAFGADESFLVPQLAHVDLLMRLGRYEEAVALLDRVPEGGDGRVLLVRARLHMARGEMPAALEVVGRAVAAEPQNVKLLIEKAAIEHAASMYEESERTLWSVLSMDATNEGAYGRLFELLDDSDNPRGGQERFLELLQQAMRSIPRSGVTRYWMASFEVFQRRRVPQGEVILVELLQDEPAHDGALRLLSLIYRDTGRKEAAVELLLKHLDDRPQDTGPVSILRAYLLLDPEERLAEYEPRVAEAAAGGELTMPRAELAAGLFTKLGRYEEALGLYDRALEAFADNGADLRFAKSMVYERIGDKGAAEQELLKVLEAEPDHAGANNNLGYMWAEQGRNLEAALEHTAKAIAAEPGSGGYMDSHAWVYYKMGKWETAVEKLREAVRLEGGESPVILDHLGDALWRVGEKEEAALQWRRAYEGLGKAENADDLEGERVRADLEAKLKALEENVEPPVAGVGG